MSEDIRAAAAKYYDLDPNPLDDVPFYERLILSPQAYVLELGCGTGRVTVPLAASCGYIHGIDRSPAMIAICRPKLEKAKIGAEKVRVDAGDITNFDLARKFDLIIAPYRVMQNLETDREVAGLFECIREHLAHDGSCILNVFNPRRDPESMRREWRVDGEIFCWEMLVDGGKIIHHERRPRMDAAKLVLYPELIYRRYERETLMDEAILKIAMRCYYPGQFEKLIVDYGFQIMNRWGGYQNEMYGQGPELVIQFRL
ncbi:class I SAM-dependent methyltransferase [candidate division KSB1 bacterium]|nr:class I SAM-dependent methyltransferase [candidate division KSB1 bacterium]